MKLALRSEEGRVRFGFWRWSSSPRRVSGTNERRLFHHRKQEWFIVFVFLCVWEGGAQIFSDIFLLWFCLVIPALSRGKATARCVCIDLSICAFMCVFLCDSYPWCLINIFWSLARIQERSTSLQVVKLAIFFGPQGSTGRENQRSVERAQQISSSDCEICTKCLKWHGSSSKCKHVIYFLKKKKYLFSLLQRETCHHRSIQHK